MIILKVQKDQSELKKDMDLNSNMIILKVEELANYEPPSNI